MATSGCLTLQGCWHHRSLQGGIHGGFAKDGSRVATVHKIFRPATTCGSMQHFVMLTKFGHSTIAEDFIYPYQYTEDSRLGGRAVSWSWHVSLECYTGCAKHINMHSDGNKTFFHKSAEQRAVLSTLGTQHMNVLAHCSTNCFIVHFVDIGIIFMVPLEICPIIEEKTSNAAVYIHVTFTRLLAMCQ